MSKKKKDVETEIEETQDQAEQVDQIEEITEDASQEDTAETSPEDEDAGEAVAAEMTLEEMTADTVGRTILERLVMEIRALPDLWQKLPKNKQDAVIDRLRKAVTEGVSNAVHIISSDGRIVVQGDLEQITIKDGTKATIKFSPSAANLARLYESSGSAVMVVVGTAGQYLKGINQVQGESDQRALNLGHEYKTDSDGEGMGEEAPAETDATEDQEKIAAYQAGYEAASDGVDADDMPEMSEELAAQWVRGFNDWHEENPEEKAA